MNKLMHRLGLLTALLAGCATQAPPSAPHLADLSAPAFRQAEADAAALDANTWRGFGDPALDALIAQARAANHDVLIAVQRVRQARAGSAAAAGDSPKALSTAQRRGFSGIAA